MPRTPAQAQRRRRRLAEMLARDGRLSVADAADRLGVNPMTIRRDLNALADSNLLVRCYGGAVAAHRISFEFAFDERRRRNLHQKRQIGAAAAERVGPGQTVLLDTGTTTLEVAGALARARTACTVVTSSLVIASSLWGREEVGLVLIGGRVRRGSPDLVGPGAEIMLETLSADVVFVGADGIDPARGCFAADMETARVAAGMAEVSRRVVVVADASKLGRAGAARYLTIDGMDELITDRGADPAAVRRLRRRGVKVTLV